MKDGAVPSTGMPPALTFEDIRKLWPRYPELVAEVTSLTGWRAAWGTLVADGEQGATASVPRPPKDKNTQPLKARAARVRSAEQQLHTQSVFDLREAKVSFQHIIWLLSTLAPTDHEIKRRLRLWSADCVARVLPLFEMACPYDTLVRNAIQGARRFARGGLANMERERVAVTAGSLLTRRTSAGLVVSAASYLVRENDSWADNVAAKYSRSATLNSHDRICETTEIQWQFERLISWMSAREPTELPLPQVPVEVMHASDGVSRNNIIRNIPSRLDHFSGREDDLLKLHELLENSDISKECHVVVRGAVGKTELAIEYAHRFAGSYSGIWWCPADSRERLIESLVALAQRMGCGILEGLSQNSIAKRVLESLAGRQPPFLLIFDHAVPSEDLYDLIPRVGSRCVVTTDQKWVETPEIVLQRLSKSEAADFLLKVVGKGDQITAEKIAALENCDLGILRSIGEECRGMGLSLQKWLEMDAAYVPYYYGRKRSTLSDTGR